MEVQIACRAAQAEDFILELPHRYLTNVGERGIQLSGGQRQRLAIARALLKNAPILPLDEATSSLDTQTERQLQRAMEFAMRGRTTIIIAHRLATVIHLPRLIVLEQGRVLDQGSHEELLHRCERYRDLVATQLIGLPEPHLHSLSQLAQCQQTLCIPAIVMTGNRTANNPIVLAPKNFKESNYCEWLNKKCRFENSSCNYYPKELLIDEFS